MASQRGVRAHFWLLAIFILLLALGGGSSRGDAQSLAILLPAAIVFFAVGLWGTTVSQIWHNRYVGAVIAIVVSVCFLQLLPLPPKIWSGLPGRQLSMQIDGIVGLQNVWRPISLVPTMTRDTMYGLFVPLAVWIWLIKLGKTERRLMLPLLIGAGLSSALLALIQVGSDPKGNLYWYAVTNNGSAVGLLANRNHQAVFLATLFPMMAVFCSVNIQNEIRQKMKLYAALGIAAMVIPLILVTGSRAGLFGGLLGILSAIYLYRPPIVSTGAKKSISIAWVNYGFAAAGIILLAVATIFMSRAEAFQRLISSGAGEDLRLKTWNPIIDSANSYFPAGSGYGSFAYIFRQHEPEMLLRTSYFNQAHNELLDLYMTGGVITLAILSAAVLGFVKTGVRAMSFGRTRHKDILLAQMSTVIICMFAGASIVDYPLRTPFLSGLFMIFVGWLACLPGRDEVLSLTRLNGN